MRRKILRIVGYSITLFVVIDLVSCRIYDAVVVPVEAEGLIRSSIDTPTGWTVSYLSATDADPDARRLIYVHGTPGDATALEGPTDHDGLLDLER